MTQHTEPTRSPREQPTPRIGPLATLPIFVKLDGRPVLLAGGDAGAAWKAELLSSAGAEVHVMAPMPSPAMLALAAERPGQVLLHLRPWTLTDFGGKALAIGAIAGPEEARAFRCAARAAGVPVNVVDQPALCDFAFGSIVNRSPLVIGISTDGAAPVFGQAIRLLIEQALPLGLARWAQAAKGWRSRIEGLHWPFRQRRSFWERFARLALAGPGRCPTEADFQSCHAAGAHPDGPSGRVTFVGAGPGDAELLTLKAVRVLQSADVILHDDLVSAEVLDLARREARKIAVGKRGHGPSCRQDRISALIVELARQGLHVVRLKGGDGGIFGRLDEELAEVRAAGFAPAIVPGISAAQGAAASAGLSLTRRGAANRLQFVTGHGAEGGLPASLDLAALADPHATTCLYMGRRTLAALRAALMARGLDSATPVLLVTQATRQDEQMVRATLVDCLEAAAGLPKEAPFLVLIGAALASPATTSARPVPDRAMATVPA